MVNVLFFHADWDHCSNKMMPVFNDVRREIENGYYKFKDIDVETEKGVQASIDYQVRTVPTVLIVKRKRVIARIKGKFNYYDLINLVRRW